MATDAAATPPIAPEGDARCAALGAEAALGILFVHGIGEQRQGETLTQCAEPIIGWIAEWRSRDVTAGRQGAPDVVSGSLRPPLLNPRDPAHARVRSSSASQTGEAGREWLLAEAWWGPQVTPPSIASFAVWLATRGSWLLLFHLVQTQIVAPKANPFSKLLRTVQVLATWFGLSLLMNMLVVVAALGALVPVGSVRRFVYTALRSVTGVLGDSYVLLRHPVQRAALHESVQTALQWVAARTQHLIVIAHSQGASVAHDALKRPDAPKVDLLITVGSGIAKLQALKYFEQLPASQRLAAVLALVFVLAFVVVLLRVAQLGLGLGAQTFGAPTVFFALGCLMVRMAWTTTHAALATLRSESSTIDLAAQQPSMTWTDIYASKDPVPAGSLRDYFDLPNLRSEVIDVMRSTLRDHTSYWSARATFLPKLIGAIGSSIPLSQIDLREASDRLRRGDESHRVSLLLLRCGQYLGVLAITIPLILAPARLLENAVAVRQVLDDGTRSGPLAPVESVLQSFESAVRWLADVFSYGGSWINQVVNWVVVAIFLILLLLAWQMVMFPIWQTWAGNRYEEALRAGPKVGNRFAPQRLRETLHVTSWTLNATFGLLVFAPITYGVLWCLLPEAVSESELYRLIGLLGAATLVAWMTMSLLLDLLLRLQGIFATLRQSPARTAERSGNAIGRVSKFRFFLTVMFTFAIAVSVLDIASVPTEATLAVALAVIAKLVVDGYETLTDRLEKCSVRSFPATAACAIFPLLTATAAGATYHSYGVALWTSATFGAMAGWLTLVVVNRMLRKPNA